MSLTRPRPRIAPYDLFAYAVGVVCLLAGTLTLALRQFQPAQARWTMGVLLILMGIYRVIHTRSQANHRKWEEEFETLREERERERPTEL